MPERWQELAAEKKQRQQASIPKEWLISVPPESLLDVTKVPEECGLLSTKELVITNSDVDELLSKLAAAEWSSVEVTTAFYKRAIIAHQLTNCLTEIFVDRALARAVELDEHLKSTGKVVGPLHGLPVSLKDQITIKGLETTMGYVSWIGKYAEKDAVLTQILYASGAVPFVRTNVPQTLMWPETFNHIFGRTSNPYNRSLTCGGSSGGEGALIALRGSPLGVGSDVGGSVRIPSNFNGIFGLRPSYGRIPYAGSVNSLLGQESVPSVLGPMSNSLDGIKVFVKSVLEQKPWLKDPLSPRKKWDEEEYQLVEHGGGKQLCFGILWDDGIVVPHPPVIRALEVTKKALIAAGHKVVDWKPFKHAELYSAVGAVWSAGSAEDYAAIVATTGEPVINSMSLAIDPNEKLATFRESSETAITAYQLWQIHKKKSDLRQEYLDHWEKTVGITGTGRPVDAIISPAAPSAAPPHGKNKHVGYTMIWNALDYSALVFPVTTVDEYLDTKKPAHEFLSPDDEEHYHLYNPESFKNAPIALQLVGRTLEEEAVIAMTEIVHGALKDVVGTEGNSV